MNFTEDLLKPVLQIPLQIAHLATSVVIPVPGFRNTLEDALQWANPNSYEDLEKMRPQLTITRIGKKTNMWTWIVVVWIYLLILRRLK